MNKFWKYFRAFGWIFFVLLLIFFALNYFGTPPPSRFVPQRCQAALPFQCIEGYMISQGEISFGLSNAFNKPLYIKSITAKNYHNQEFNCTSELKVINVYENSTFTCPIPNDVKISEVGSKERILFIIEYYENQELH